jgi:homoserine dehydrogenase
MTALRIGIAGLGTVGGGVVKLLAKQAEVIATRAGRPIVVTTISARSKRDRGFSVDGLTWHDNPVAVATDPNVDVVVELIGGSDGPAKALAEAAIAAGKPFVTANKALLAVHGGALAEAAEAKGVTIAYEAAVAGGIPVIKALREGLAANTISRVAGILNGTCNYILTTMREEGRGFEDVLADAQALGYAEADPSFDIDGVDAAHKLAILAGLAFGARIRFDDLHIEGIRRVSALDIAFANELGYRIKLLGIAERTAGGLSLRVHPTMVPAQKPIATVDGVFNAVQLEGDFSGPIFLRGRGAGEGPTASAVVADLIDIARGNQVPVWGQAAATLTPAQIVPMAELASAYFLRLMVVDQPGVLADVTAILRDHGISLESMLQHGRKPAEAVPIVLVTHETSERAVAAALGRISALEAVLEAPAFIRIEPK